MNFHEIIIGPSAQKELRKLSQNVRKQVFKKLDSMKLDPRPRGADKLTDMPNLYRVCVGKKYRVIYTILISNKIVVLVVRDRKDAYRGIKGIPNKVETALNYIETQAKSVAGLR